MKAKLQAQMSKWTAVIAGLLGLASFGFLLQPPPTPSISRAASVAYLGLRRPANAPSPVSVENEATAEAHIACRDGALVETAPSIKQIRLFGAFCSKNASRRAEPITVIKNLSNRFVGTAFYAAHGKFSTDYLSLAPGRNSISISHRWADGYVESREVVVMRAAAIN